MTGRRTRFQAKLPVALTLIFAIFGFAGAAHADLTVRAARLTFIQGTVTVSTPDNPTPAPAQLNLPLLTGVQLATGADGQAEVEFEDGSIARLTPNSALSLDNLAVEPSGVFTTNLTLLHGLGYFELRATPQYLYAVAAGGAVLSPIENTTIRVNCDELPAIFSVLDGTAQVERQGTDPAGAGFQADVRAGESLTADPNDPARYFLTQEIASDSWDQWNEDLDQAAAAQTANSTSVRDNYAGAQGYGWSDLDADGSWYDVPGQGPVWQPQVAADDSAFDPYGDGDWVSYPGIGYVWASAYPWGWTPYRCGAWSYFDSFGWGWQPGLACGGLGWGFAGGGRPVNIAVGPAGYHPIRVPTGAGSGPHPIRPVRPVHAAIGVGPSVAPVSAERGPRQFAGVTVSPIKPVAGAVPYTNGPAVGSSLRRDFPINSANHTPSLGLAGTSPAVVHTTSGLRWTGENTVTPSASGATRPSPSAPQSRPQPAASSQHYYTPPPQRPAPRSAPAPHYAPRPMYSPPPPRPMAAPPPRPAPPPARGPR